MIILFSFIIDIVSSDGDLRVYHASKTLNFWPPPDIITSTTPYALYPTINHDLKYLPSNTQVKSTSNYPSDIQLYTYYANALLMKYVYNHGPTYQ